MDYTVHGILQARILEWVAFPFSRVSSQPKDLTQVSHVAGRFIDFFFNHCIIQKTIRLEPLYHSVKIYLIVETLLQDYDFLMLCFPQKMSQEYKEV